MNQETHKVFTVFGSDHSNYVTSANPNRPQTLDELIKEAGSRFDPCFWAPETTDLWHGPKSERQLYAESIELGRVIDWIDGRYVAQGEPIAPTFYCAAETLRVDPTENIYAANPDEMTFEELMADFRQRQARTQTQPEKVRAPLDWADSKPFDAFKGFSSSSDTATPDHAYSHYLTRVADAGAQVSAEFGSAWLVVR